MLHVEMVMFSQCNMSFAIIVTSLMTLQVMNNLELSVKEPRVARKAHFSMIIKVYSYFLSKEKKKETLLL